MEHDFGPNDSLNLGYIDTLVNEQISGPVFDLLKQIGFDPTVNTATHLEIPAITASRRPARGYTAKSVYTISSEKMSLGDELHSVAEDRSLGTGQLVVCAFIPGDATGDTHEQTSFKYLRLPDFYYPRPKSGAGEIYFPIGTGFNNIWHPGITSLEVLTSKNKIPEDRLPLHKTLNLDKTNFLLQLLEDMTPEYAAPIDTTFLNYNKIHEGDPHVVVFERNLVPSGLQYENFFQLGAFLSFPEADDDFRKIIEFINRSNP